MDANAKKCSEALLWLHPKEMLHHADASSDKFYREYYDRNKSEVLKIPKSNQGRRKKAMNNITGRASKLKKDWTVAVSRCLLDGLVERVTLAADSFDSAVSSLSSDCNSGENGIDDEKIQALVRRVAEFRAAAATRASAGTTVHDVIKQNACRDGERAGQWVFERKLAEVATSISTPPSLALPSPVMSIVPTTPSPSANDPLSALELALAWPSHAAAVDAAIETVTPEPAAQAPVLQLPPAVLATNHSQYGSPSPVKCKVTSPGGNGNGRSAKSVARSIKNNVAATRTNQTRRSLVLIYRQQVEEHANLLADLQEVTLSISNTPSTWIDDALFAGVETNPVGGGPSNVEHSDT